MPLLVSAKQLLGEISQARYEFNWQQSIARALQVLKQVLFAQITVDVQGEFLDLKLIMNETVMVIKTP